MSKKFETRIFPHLYQRGCLDECKTKHLVRTCGCGLHYMPRNATLCTVDDYAICTTDFLRNFWKTMNVIVHCLATFLSFIIMNYRILHILSLWWIHETRFARRGLPHTPLQHTDFTTILSMCACIVAYSSPVCFPEAVF